MSETLDRTDPINVPLRLDPYATSSLLQKAIRRGEAELAERAAERLYRLRGKGVFRRFLIIAFEDVGIGSVDALVQTVARVKTADAGMGEANQRAVGAIARLLAEAPKDRSADHLIGAAWSHPAFEDARRVIGDASHAERLDLVAEHDASLPVRAIAAWRASGMTWSAKTHRDRGDLDALMATYRKLGAPPDLVLASREAALRTREPIVAMAPLLWLAADWGSSLSIAECPAPEAPIIDGVPLYVFDKHTAIGKAAIHRLANDSQPVRAALRAFAPEARAREVAAMAAFYADAAPVSRRLEWEGSAALDALGVEADMLRAGALIAGVAPILKTVRDNLGHLNLIRARLFSRR